MAKKKESLTPEQRLQEALVPESEWPYKVPENWCWTYLNSVSHIVTGGTPSKKVPEYYGGSFPFFKPTDLDAGRHVFYASEYLSEAGKDVSQIIPQFSTAVCCIGSIGKCGFLELEGTTNQQINSAIPRFNPLYLYYYCSSNEFSSQLWKKASATTISIVNKAKMESCAFPLAPLSEQERIVDRIESLFAKLDEAKQKAQDVVDGFETRKAAILHKAFTGELTENWRAVQDPSPNMILKNIKNISSQWSKRDIAALTIEQDKAIPIRMSNGHEWFKCTIGAVSCVSNGSTPSRKINEYWGGDIPWVSSGEVKNTDIFTTKERITHSGYDNSSVKLLPVGTVLIAMIGEGKTRGQSAVLQISATINQNIAAIVTAPDLVNPYYLAYWLQKNYTVNRQKGAGSGAQALNCQRVRELDFILAGINEQQEIVRVLDDLLSKEQQAKEAAEAVLEQIDLIKKSILARAFRGELGTNDPTEESAVELLKEILEKEG